MVMSKAKYKKGPRSAEVDVKLEPNFAYRTDTNSVTKVGLALTWGENPQPTLKLTDAYTMALLIQSMTTALMGQAALGDREAAKYLKLLKEDLFKEEA